MALDEIKQKIMDSINLEQLVGESVRLQRRSGRLVACCPFHEEKTPSFTLYSDGYHCFGCGAHGDAIDFIRNKQGLGFIEALQVLADRSGYGEDIAKQMRGESGRHQRRKQLFECLEQAHKVFVQNLADSDGQKTRAYLENRGFDTEACKKFGFGLALNESTQLLRRLSQRGFAAELLGECSLANTRGPQKTDFFQNRLIIPITDPHGRVIAFGGRALDDHPAKYINSRDTDVFHKKRTLFGLHQARSAILESKVAVIVEGYMDVLSLWNHGLTNTVACLGTAVTEHHLRSLGNIANEVVLLLDGDQAGLRASLRSVQAALKVGRLRLKVARLPKNSDPDSTIREHGKEHLADYINKSEDLLQFAIRQQLESSDSWTVPELLRQEIIPWLKAVDDPLLQGVLLNQVSQLTGVGKTYLERHMRNTKAPVHREEALTSIEAPPEPSILREPNRIELSIIAHLFFATPEALDLQSLRESLENLDHHEWPLPWQELWQKLLLELSEGTSPASIPTGKLSPDEMVAKWLESQLATSQRFELNANTARQQQILQLVDQHQIQQLSKLKSRIKNRFIKSEADGATPNDLNDMLKRLMDIDKQLSTLSSKQLKN